MAATTTLLGLVTPTQGTLSGTWGDTVNYGISDYVDISVAGTLTLTNDGAVNLQNTTGSSSGNSITSSLTGAGTVTAQFAIVRVTGTLTVAKVVTGPSYSKTYTVVNAATGGIVTFKASGQTGVSVAVGESAFVYFNGTDYVKVSGTVAVASFSAGTTGLTPNTATTGAVTLAGTLATTNGGTGLTSFTSGGVVYASSTSALATGSGLKFDGSNLGIGVTPSATNSSIKLLDINTTGSIASYSDSTTAQFTYLSSNAFLNSGLSWTYKLTGITSSAYMQSHNAGHIWYTAASGTAGNTISFAQPMTLDTSGNLMVGMTSPLLSTSGRGNITLNGSSETILSFGIGGNLASYIYSTASAMHFNAQTSRTINFETGGAERARIPSTGGIQSVNSISVGNATPSTSGAGITFPATQSASSDANTLDDYEEGTFTPTIIGTTSAGVGTYGVQTGVYTKVGKLVSIQIYLGWTAHTGTGNMQVSGLPFTTTSVYGTAAVGYVNDLAMTAGHILGGYFDINNTIFILQQFPTGGGAQASVPMDTQCQFMLAGTYFV